MSYNIDDILNHILIECSYLIDNSNIQEEEYSSDETLMRAFSRSLEIIGEAVKKFPTDFKLRYPHIDWRSMAGMRDKLIHDYFGVDYQLVWDIVKNEIPILNDEIKKIKTQLGN